MTFLDALSEPGGNAFARHVIKGFFSGTSILFAPIGEAGFSSRDAISDFTSHCRRRPVQHKHQFDALRYKQHSSCVLLRTGKQTGWQSQRDSRRGRRLKLNDPFGRVSKKNQRNYHSLRDRLLQEEIRDPAAIARFTKNMTATALRLAVVILGASIVLVVLFPTLLGTLLALGALVLLWIGVGYFQTRLHLKRYAREECNEGRQGPRT